MAEGYRAARKKCEPFPNVQLQKNIYKKILWEQLYALMSVEPVHF